MGARRSGYSTEDMPTATARLMCGSLSSGSPVGTSGIPRSTSTSCFVPATASSPWALWAPKNGAIYHSMTTLTGISPDSRQLVADTAQQFDRVRSLADGETEYLHGVIEFYQTVLSVKSTLLGQAQNEKVQQLTEASYAQNEEIKKISAWAAIFFAPTLIGTVYGMNFDHMPESHWVIGYPFRAARNGAVVGRPLLVV
jgi:hypothetical protein